jgi:hypothetical protein
MITITNTPAVESSSNPILREALQSYERRFGSPPEWLDELPKGRILSFVRQALQRGVPLIAAEVLH